MWQPAAASASVSWRAAGPGRERGGDGARAVGQVGAQVGQADGPLAGAGAAEAGPLGQLQLAEAAVPHAVEVIDGGPGARADDTVDGRRRQGVLRRGRADDAHPALGRDAGQDVARRRAEADHDGSARVGLEDAVVLEDRARDGAVRVAVEADELPGHGSDRQPIGHIADRDRVGQLHTRRVPRRRRPTR